MQGRTQTIPFRCEATSLMQFFVNEHGFVSSIFFFLFPSISKFLELLLDVVYGVHEYWDGLKRQAGNVDTEALNPRWQTIQSKWKSDKALIVPFPRRTTGETSRRSETLQVADRTPLRRPSSLHAITAERSS
jgi:hypothetical protein